MSEQAARNFLRRAFETANKIGDLTFAAYSRINLNTNLLIAGDPLAEVQQEAMNGLRYAQQIRFGLAVDHIKSQLGLICTLRGLTPESSDPSTMISSMRLGSSGIWRAIRYWRNLSAFTGSENCKRGSLRATMRLLWMLR